MIQVESMQSLLLRGVGLIEDTELHAALRSVFFDTEGLTAIEACCRFFDELTTQPWSQPVLNRFVSGWGDLHQSAMYVSGMIVRVLRACTNERDADSRQLFVLAASELAEVIPEDAGVDGPPHDELFRTFGCCLTGTDEWQSGRFKTPACQDFRSFIRDQRLKAPLQEAMLTTAASEHWNSGEYTICEPSIRAWMQDLLKRDVSDVKQAMPYISAHAGETEASHFLHAIRAWQNYCQAIRIPADPELAANVFRQYLIRLAATYESFREIWNSESRSE